MREISVQLKRFENNQLYSEKKLNADINTSGDRKILDLINLKAF